MAINKIKMQKLCQKNFKKAGTILIDTIYKSTSDDTELNGVVTPGGTTDQPLKILLDEFNQTINQSGYRSNDDVQILSIDKKALFPTLDLAVIPKVDDIISIGAIEWIVKGISTDPVEALQTLHIRPFGYGS